ncbi:uncharacterized protein LOC106066185 isoform X2 [Biomphalaria glabrata]|uniref:Uncharacterized protein LOC106066185 isoform X2 n=1 Tax=Biomphalaria glabrata TaxID=6526 RepID=A0A9W3BK39_BIOGL|nr:uncharacterized protein LOC106066185 isoform X2 [Biomphalaria glabrata]
MLAEKRKVKTRKSMYSMASHLLRRPKNCNEYPHGTAVLSERQTKARGAKDHTWDASNTGNIYVSFILHLPATYKTHEGRFDLEVAACLAVLETVKKYGVTQAVSKWPNDIWVKGHKLAGFLAEDGRYDIPGSHNSLLILGMGINVNADVRRSAELNSIATSLLCEKDGQAVSREQFFADVCLILEKRLSCPREDLLSNFKAVNLFREHSKIVVSCLSGGAAIDADFIEICNNWDIMFLDNSTGKTMTGNSQNFSVRPKVLKKILVVTSGPHNMSASHLSRWFMSILDTSKFVVCLVPESAITTSDAWMKSCSLLVIAEQTHEPELLGENISIYLKSGGSVLSNGFASLFLAKHLGVHMKEIQLDSFISETNLSLVRLHIETNLESNEKQTPQNGVNNLSSDCMLDNNSTALALSSKPILFPTCCTCFQFYEDEKALLYESGQTVGLEISVDTINSLCINNGDGDHSQDCHKSGSPTSIQLKAFYLNSDKLCKSVALFIQNSGHGGKVGFLGFDAGVDDPSSVSDTPEFSDAHSDRFRRDKLMMHVLDVLLG